MGAGRGVGLTLKVLYDNNYTDVPQHQSRDDDETADNDSQYMIAEKEHSLDIKWQPLERAERARGDT